MPHRSRNPSDPSLSDEDYAKIKAKVRDPGSNGISRVGGSASAPPAVPSDQQEDYWRFSCIFDGTNFATSSFPISILASDRDQRAAIDAAIVAYTQSRQPPAPAALWAISSPLTEVANDNESGAFTDISVARPAVDDAMTGAAHLGHYSRAARSFLKDGDTPPTSLLFANGTGTASDGQPAVKLVDNTTAVWSKPADPKVYTMSTPTAADPYVAVGDVFESVPAAIDAEKAHYALVHKDFCMQVPLGDVVWQDKGSGAATDATAWAIGQPVPIAGVVEVGMAVLFKASSSFDRPEGDAGMAWALKDDVWVEVDSI